MKFKDRIKSYKFWVALSASLIILLQALGEAFGFTISEKIVDGIVMGFCSVLVVFGFVERPDDSEKDSSMEDGLKGKNTKESMNDLKDKTDILKDELNLNLSSKKDKSRLNLKANSSNQNEAETNLESEK